MRILIDIGHPAHVHYFRNLIKIMKKKGHEFLVVSRNKEVSHKLLKAYNIDYYNRGRGGKGLLGKILYVFKGDYIIFRLATKFKPDIFLSFGSPYAAHVARIMNKPHISPDDTEHAKLAIFSFVPLTDVILTPECFGKDFGKKQVRFKGYMELSYLHPNYYQPDRNILNYLGVNESQPFVILRFVSWNANHDIGYKGMSLIEKIKLVKELSKITKVFISSEAELSPELKPFEIKTDPEKIHDILTYATLYIGEGATMASECAMLGTPAIYINPLHAGTLREQESLDLVHHCLKFEDILSKAFAIISNPDTKRIYKRRQEKMLSANIDVTSFFVWFIENYPKSQEIIRNNPDYQLKFLTNAN